MCHLDVAKINFKPSSWVEAHPVENLPHSGNPQNIFIQEAECTPRYMNAK